MEEGELGSENLRLRAAAETVDEEDEEEEEEEEDLLLSEEDEVLLSSVTSLTSSAVRGLVRWGAEGAAERVGVWRRGVDTEVWRGLAGLVRGLAPSREDCALSAFRRCFSCVERTLC